MSARVTTTLVRNIRDGGIKADTGRFITGGRRGHHVAGSSSVSREALERVCLTSFRNTMGGTGP